MDENEPINFPVVSKAPLYIKDYTHLYFTGSKTLESKVSLLLFFGLASASDAPSNGRKITPTCVCLLYKDDLILCAGNKAAALSSVPPASPCASTHAVRGENGVTSSSADTQSYTESALKELFQQVTNMPESAKKKKLIRQVNTGVSPSKWTS